MEKKENSTGKYFYYDLDEYCLEPKNNTDSNSIDWEIKYCEYEANTHAIVHLVRKMIILGETSICFILLFYFSRVGFCGGHYRSYSRLRYVKLTSHCCRKMRVNVFDWTILDSLWIHMGSSRQQ